MITESINGFTAIFGENSETDNITSTTLTDGITDISESLDSTEPDFSFNPHSKVIEKEQKEVIEKEEKENKNKPKTSIDDEELEEETESEETEVEEEVTKETDEKDSDNTNDEEIPEEAVHGLFDIFSEKLGLDLDDDFEKPKTIDEFIEVLNNIVEENSIPEYANDEIKQLDDFVRNGGKLNDFIKLNQEFDIEDVDISNENSQKLVLRKFLEHQGFGKEQINKKLEKYEDAGILEDEAEDALEELKIIKEKSKEKLLSDQEKQNKLRIQEQQETFDNVVSTIKSLDNINGIAISSKEKQELIKYIFEPTKSGKTQWQEDGKDIKNIVISAYFTKSGPALIDSATKKGKSEAYSKLKTALRQPSGNKTRTIPQDKPQGNSLSMITKFFGGSQAQ